MWMEWYMWIPGENIWEPAIPVFCVPASVNFEAWCRAGYGDPDSLGPRVPWSIESHVLPPLPWAGSVWEKRSLALCIKILRFVIAANLAYPDQYRAPNKPGASTYVNSCDGTVTLWVSFYTWRNGNSVRSEFKAQIQKLIWKLIPSPWYYDISYSENGASRGT